MLACANAPVWKRPRASMPLQFHPKAGTIVICDFGTGFRVPEMVKRRPSVVISPPIQGRPGLCTIVPISTERPRHVMSYHLELPNLALPPPFEEGPNWVKADMMFPAAFSRLDLIRSGRDGVGRRTYGLHCVTDDELKAVRRAVLCSIGLSSLTKHLT